MCPSRSQPRDLLSRLNSEGSLIHLNRFQKELTTEEYWQASQFFLHGGWSEVIKQYFYESPERSSGDDYSPVVILPGDELGARRIEPLPLVYSEGITLSDMVLKTAWIRGLSPRLIYFNSGQQGRDPETVLKFIKRREPLPFNYSRPPELISIDRTLLSVDTAPKVLDTRNETNSRGKKLLEIISELTTPATDLPPGSSEPVPIGRFSYFHGKIFIEHELKHQFVRIRVEDTLSLVEILNAIAYYLDAVWEWIDDKIFIGLHPGSGATVHSWLSEEEEEG
ncbi:MAG: hypothetical protein SNF33_03695 [Candidatus Algichlamydia australiensis]|nr:hypothetical protein [Chlamydiales bacterium]